jgi:hypothetical protein
MSLDGDAGRSTRSTSGQAVEQRFGWRVRATRGRRASRAAQSRCSDLHLSARPCDGEVRVSRTLLITSASLASPPRTKTARGARHAAACRVPRPGSCHPCFRDDIGDASVMAARQLRTTRLRVLDRVVQDRRDLELLPQLRQRERERRRLVRDSELRHELAG